jgi:dTDP-4-amino-4,6-dideoxygalactose transaminase
LVDESPIHLFVPTFDVEACVRELRDSLERGWTGMGDKTVVFEKAWSDFTGRQHVHFLNSATSGLHLAIKLLAEKHGWQPDSEVITTPITFVSTNHAISYEGFTPVFADVDSTGCLTHESVRAQITPKTCAVMFVGLGGNVGNLADIAALCRQRGLQLILDAAHMAGTRLRSGGDATFDADAVVYSFQAVKNLPTGDSGAVSFLDSNLDRRTRALSWLGIDKDTYTRTLQKGTYRWDYDVPDVGYKYNGNSLMAGIALAQLPHLDRDNAYRRALADHYLMCLRKARLDVVCVEHDPYCLSARHLFQVRVENRDAVMMKLNALNVFPGVHYKSNTLYAPYTDARGADACPVAMQLSESLMSLPLHLRMGYAHVERVVRSLREAMA